MEPWQLILVGTFYAIALSLGAVTVYELWKFFRRGN